MLHYNFATRATSMVLAMELLFAPVAMARAADPLLGWEDNEVEEGLTGEMEEVDEGFTISPEEEGLTDADAGQNEAESEPNEGGNEAESEPNEGGNEAENDPTEGENEAENDPDEDEKISTSEKENVENFREIELSAVDLQADDEDDEYEIVTTYYAVFGPGLPTSSAANGQLTQFDNVLGYELADDQKGTSWIYRAGTLNNRKPLVEKDGEFYVNAPQVGRVPDMKFEGFYALTEAPEGDWYGGSVDNENLVRAWEQDGDTYAFAETSETSLTEMREDVDYTWERVNLQSIQKSSLEALVSAGLAGTETEDDDTGVWDDEKDALVYYRYVTHYIPIVGKWSKSDNNDLTAFTLTTHGGDSAAGSTPTVYTEDPRNNQNRNNSGVKLDITATEKWWTKSHTAGKNEFWVFVGEDQSKLDLSFTTYEPHYEQLKNGENPVTITATFNGATLKDGEGNALTVTGAVTTESGVEEGSRSFINSAEDPARGVWTVKDIPLNSVLDAEDSTKPFTELVIELTAPDGAAKTQYVFHIERRTETEVTLGYGNTPAGLIWKDTSADWGEGEEAETKKLAAVNYFEGYRKFDGMEIKPMDSGALYSGMYDRSAWTKDLDLDATAVVAYLDSAFDDVGIAFVDGENVPVRFGDKADVLANDAENPYARCVTRTIKLKRPAGNGALTAESYTGATEEVYYVSGVNGQTFLRTEVFKQTMKKGDGSDVIDLRGLNVLPGVYEIVYTFTDPATDEVTEAKRPLVILPIPGDVDMDGAVTVADGEVLSKYGTAWSSSTNAVCKAVYYRAVANVKLGDNSGATAIRNGFQPVTGDKGNGRCDYMYPPLSASDVDGYSQKTWGQLETAEGSRTGANDAKLELKFLGKEEGTKQAAGHTNNITGPWKADSTESVSNGDVFWVGVYLTAGDLSGAILQDLSIALTYDSRYVKPATVYAQGADSALTDEGQKWSMLTLYQYNQGDGSKDERGQARTVLSGYKGEVYNYAYSASARDYATHYSKVQGVLASDAGREADSRLKELVYSLYYSQNAYNENAMAKLTDGYLLVVPFEIINQPIGQSSGTFVELSAGMRDITIVTHQPAEGAAARGAERGATVSTMQTLAYSAQESIFGGATENLREGLTLNATLAAPAILLGEDTVSPVTIVTNQDQLQPEELGKNARYDVKFQSSSLGTTDAAEGQTVNGVLSDIGGLSFDATSGVITGTPQKACPEGVEFAVNGNRYKLIVEKKKLSYAVDPARSYYGQSEYRGSNSTDFTFTISSAQLSAADRQALGVGADEKVADSKFTTEGGSALLSGYTAGKFQAQSTTDTAGDGATAVKAETPVRNSVYPIRTLTNPTAENYEFVRTDSSGLLIEKRPIWVRTIEADFYALDRSEKAYTTAIYHTEGQKTVTFAVDEGKNTESIPMVVTLTYDNGMVVGGKYDGLPLNTSILKVNNDKLTLTFKGTYTFIRKDDEQHAVEGANGSWFAMSDSVEERPIHNISSITLTGDSANNYRLVSATAEESCDVQGSVLRQGISSIELAGLPPALNGGTVTAGNRISDDRALRVRIQLSNDSVGAYDYMYEGADLKAWDLHYNWVSPEQKALGEKAENAGKNSATITHDDGTTETISLTNWEPNGATQDLKPYNGTDPITADMDGWYLCVVAKKYNESTSGEVEYMKTYSQKALKVQSRTIQITPKATGRFYGEDNGALTYTYNYQQLSDADQTALKNFLRNSGDFGYDTPKGTRQELEAFLTATYPDEIAAGTVVLPKVVASTVEGIPEAGQEVTATTAAGSANRYVVVYGGKWTGYDFWYYQTGSGSSVVSKDYGNAKLVINPRPVVVKAITKQVTDESAEGGTKQVTDDFATIYADAYNLKLTVQVDGEDESAFRAEGSKGEMAFMLPETQADTGYVTYYNKSGEQIVRTGMTMASSEAVLADDMAKLTLTYAVTFIPDENMNVWSGMSANYFDMNGQSQKKGAVELSGIKLSGEAAGNYELVYTEQFHATKQAPAKATILRDRFNPTETDTTTAFLQYGEGNVVQRPVESMKLISLGRMDYTYGDYFSPYQTQTGSNKRLSLQLTYGTRYGENPAAVSTTHETVKYESVMNGETESDSFTARNMVIYYLKDGQTTLEANENGQTIDGATALIPAKHDGAKLFVANIVDGETQLISEISDKALEVKKAKLTITANNFHRFYGETEGYTEDENAFTFPLSQLAQRDLARISDATASGTGTAANFTTVFGGETGYVAPMVTRQAATNAYTTGNSSYGKYSGYVKLTIGGATEHEYDNYIVTTENADLYIYPRPIRVTNIVQGKDRPVYTIYADNGTKTFTTTFSTTEPTVAEGETQQPYVTVTTGAADGVKVYAQTLATGGSKTLPLTGDGLVGSDALRFNASLTFYDEGESKWDLNGTSNATLPQVSAAITAESGLYADDAAKNYRLSSGWEKDGLYGAVKLRTIGEIYITSKPKTEGYTYGDTLDLSGLTVRVVYKKGEGENAGTEEVTVQYASAEQFAGYGLYVNYYPEKALLSADKANDAAIKGIVAKYRTAASGDHLTIAPDHSYKFNGSDWCSNGQYLVVSAFQAGEGQTPCTPKIIGSTTTGNYESYEADPAKLKVEPLLLQYELEAADKTYDGTTAAAGTLTFTNVYTESGTNSDAIYVPIGAAYEARSGGAYSEFFAVSSQVTTDGKLSFTVGRYDASASGSGISWWSESYDRQKHLKFDFVNANVHYEDENSSKGFATESLRSYWKANQDFTSPTDGEKMWDSYPDVTAMPVEVGNLKLMGPDAANYVLTTSPATKRDTTVTMATRATAVDGQASAPYATIHKAKRGAITALVDAAGSPFQGRRPALMLDTHTNAIRVDFLSQSDLTNALWNNNNASGAKDDYQKELHFEYALFYETDGAFTRWAGDDGEGEYQDTRFFGGETVAPIPPAGWVADEERLPGAEQNSENATKKGQVYPWLDEDNGKSELGYESGSGMSLFTDAYPGGADNAGAYSGYYFLLKTDRTALTRDRVYYPILRLAETHNYLASDPITADDTVTSQMLLDAMDGTDKAAVITAAQGMNTAAQDAAAEHTALEAAMGEGKWEEDYGPVTAQAVKTFRQRIELMSVSSQRNKNDPENTEYLVELLEAVWFTDTQYFEELKHFEGVIYNHPTRYYGYYWDKGLTTALQITKEKVLDLRDRFQVTIKEKNGGEIEVWKNEGSNLQLYVTTTSSAGNSLRKITIVPSVLYARLGDEPFQLGIVTVPEKPSDRRYKWTSSDSSVATVDETGLVTFRGVGTCTITVTASNGRNATIQVVVSEALALETESQPIFNFRYDGPWDKLDEAMNFRPKEEMTRGQLALLLDKFLDPAGQWQATNELAYLDIKEGDKYYDALRRLTGAGVVKGIPGGRFAPEQPVTRAEFAAMLARMLRLKLPEAPSAVPAFRDCSPEDTWAWAYIEALAKTGATRGVGEGYFAPERVLTREESAVILARLLVTTLDPNATDLILPADVAPENWSYQSILRAVNSVIYPD